MEADITAALLPTLQSYVKMVSAECTLNKRNKNILFYMNITMSVNIPE